MLIEDISKEKENDVKIGMYIYHGKKEINLDAIKTNSWEIIGIYSKTSGTSLELRNMFDNRIEITEIDKIYQPSNNTKNILIIEDSLDSLIEQLVNIENTTNDKTIPTLSVPNHLLIKADEIIKKIQDIDDLIAKLRIENKTYGVEKGFRQLLIEACKILNDRDPYNFKLHPSSYYAKKKQLLSCNEDRVIFASSLHRSSYHKTKIDNTTLHFIDTIILHFLVRDNFELTIEKVYTKIIKELLERTQSTWINPEKCNKIPENLVHDLLNVNIPFENIISNEENLSLLSKVNLPSRAWFYRYVRYYKANPVESEKNIRKRFGDDFYENSIMVFDSFVVKAKYPLHYVFIDHCLLDIFILDEETRSRPYKVWLTVLIDAYSRCILGIALLDEAPSVESVQTALKNAIWPKSDWLQNLQINSDLSWESYGIPVNLSFDNAWAHHSYTLENLIKRLGANNQFRKPILLFRPPYKGRYGAVVERFFGNLQSQMKEYLLGAYTSRDFRYIRDARHNACLLYSDLLKFLIEIILKYMHEPHSELFGMTPTEKWIEGLGDTIPKIPQLTKEVERYFWRSWPSPRYIQQDGIHLFNLTYFSPGLLTATKVGMDKRQKECSISYDIDDISTLAIFQDEKWICDVKANDLQISSDKWMKMSLAELNIAKQLSKNKDGTTKNWLKFSQEAKELNETRKKEKWKISQKHGRNKKQKNNCLPNYDPNTQNNDDVTKILANFVKNSGEAM